MRPRRILRPHHAAGSDSESLRGFEARLRGLGISPERNDIWLMVGSPQRAAGWKLHVSSTLTGIHALFGRVLPRLARRGTPFKMAADRHTVMQLNSGVYGEKQIGKIVTIYPRDDNEALELAHELIKWTRDLPGPTVATDLHVGAAIYARYGAFHSRVAHDRFGEAKELIPNGNGEWVPDTRAVPFAAPPNIYNPFPTAPPAGGRAPANKRRRLKGRYFVTDVLHPGLAGSVLRAIDLSAAGGPAVCVLKQARPHCSEDRPGRDRRMRLRHESEVLHRLRRLKIMAPAGGYFEEEGIGYLPLVWLQGRRLGQLVEQYLAERAWRSLREDKRRRLLGFAVQLVRCVRAAHARGVIHRDVSPNNVWIGDGDRVWLLDWECAHVVRSRVRPFLLGTPGFSDRAHPSRVPTSGDDWHACAMLLVYILTGLNPASIAHGTAASISARLTEITGTPDLPLTTLLAHTLADKPTATLDARTLLRAITATIRGHGRRRRHQPAPLFNSLTHEAVVREGLEASAGVLRKALNRLRAGQATGEAAWLDVHSGIAGLLYVLADAHRVGAARLDASLARRAVRALTTARAVTPNLPGLVHGSAGRALAVATAVQAGCVPLDDALSAWVASALEGILDWPDFTHGAAGQGFAAIACAERLGNPRLADYAKACTTWLIRTQDPDGAWTLPAGVSGASGERFTGFAHGVAGIMAFLGRHATLTGDASADAAWRHAEAWLVSRVRRGRGGKLQWPRSDNFRRPWSWWCHGTPGIALGWLTVARAQSVAAMAEEHLRGALASIPTNLRSDSLSQCHGLAGVGEVYLEAHSVLGEECWRERATEISKVLVALCRRRSGRGYLPWLPPHGEPGPQRASTGLMLGTVGILHFLLRHHYPSGIVRPPLLP